jgi:hypothetical protein
VKVLVEMNAVSHRLPERHEADADQNHANDTLAPLRDSTCSAFYRR